jgi:hypothetical protein
MIVLNLGMALDQLRLAPTSIGRSPITPPPIYLTILPRDKCGLRFSITARLIPSVTRMIFTTFSSSSISFGRLPGTLPTPPSMRRPHSSPLLSHSNLRANFLPNGIHNPGELRQSQLSFFDLGGICHDQRFVLGSLDQPTPRADRSSPRNRPSTRARSKSPNLCQLWRLQP